MALAKSTQALIASRSQVNKVDFNPPGGPVESITLPPSAGKPTLAGKYHVVVTGDSRVYGRWQILTNYYWYKKVKEADPTGPMGGYTRILHSTDPDPIAHIVPTIRMEPLPVNITRSYAVLNRPWAITQWLASVYIEEEYVFMTEPDHVFVRQIPLFAAPSHLAVWPFWYINCHDAKAKPHCENPAFNPERVPLADIPRTGNSPTMVHKATLAQVAPIWDKIARAIHADEAADKALGWVQEMYAFSLALATAKARGVAADVKYHYEMMVEPPFASDMRVDTCKTPANIPQPDECPGGPGHGSDATWRDVCILHFTFGQDFDEQGKHTWGKEGPYHWNKRQFIEFFPPTPIPMPPAGTPAPSVELMKRISEVAESEPLWKAYSRD